MLYVLYGTERLLMDQRLDKLKKDHHCNQERMNYTVYDVSKEGMKVVLEDVMTPPFLSDEKNFDERKKVVKMLRKEAQFYEINPLNYYKVSDTARQAVKKRNCTIDDDALELLLSRKGTNLMDIASEVEKLCLYTQHIDIHCVEELVSRPLDENVFDLTTAILSKDKQKMMSIYKDLMTINEEPVKLIVLVANSMRLIYQVKLLDRKGYTDQEIAKMLAVNPFRLKYVRKEGRFFQIDELLRCLNELSLLDVKIKTGQIDKKLGLELFMLRI